MELKVYTTQEDLFDYRYHYNGTYLHGEMESDYEYDIFSFNQDLGLKEGIHELMISNIKCIFYLYRVDYYGQDKWRGLLVYAKDKKSNEYARGVYNKKSINI